MTKFAKKSLLLLLVVLLVAAFACSCGGEKDPTETTDPTVTSEPDATTAPLTTTEPAIQRPEEINYKEYYPLYVQEGLIYHINFAPAGPDADEYPARNSHARYYPFYATIDEHKIGDTWWDGFQCPIHNGYIEMVQGNSIYFYSTVIQNHIPTVKQFSVEFTIAGSPDSYATFGVGPQLRFNIEEDSFASFTVDTWGWMLKDPDKLAAGETVDYTKDSLAVKMAVDGTKINTYVFNMDISELEQSSRYSFNVYANGKSYGERANLLSPTNTFKAWGQMPLREGEMRMYAMRIYDKQLSAEEALQNHFMDIALYNGFDLAEFKALDDAKKLSIYKAFEPYAADEDYSLLVKAFDDAMAAVKQ